MGNNYGSLLELRIMACGDGGKETVHVDMSNERVREVRADVGEIRLE